MRYKPHFYQTYAKDFILHHKEAAVFLDCRLGKTVVTLTAIEELLHDFFEIGTVLVIAPLHVAGYMAVGDCKVGAYEKHPRLSGYGNTEGTDGSTHAACGCVYYQSGKCKVADRRERRINGF